MSRDYQYAHIGGRLAAPATLLAETGLFGLLAYTVSPRTSFALFA